MEGGFFDWEAPLIERYLQKGHAFSLRLRALAERFWRCAMPASVRMDLNAIDGCWLPGKRSLNDLASRNSVVFCEPDRVSGRSQIYEGVIVGWRRYTHIPTRLRRGPFLQALSGRTLPHSALVMSFFIRNESSRIVR